MFSTRMLVLTGIVMTGAVAERAAAQQLAAPSAVSAAAHRATLEQYCIGCHSGPTPFAGLNLQNLDPANLEENGAIWEKMIRKLRDRQMPPAGMPRPDPVTYQAFIDFIEKGRDRLAEIKPNPGLRPCTASTGRNTPTRSATCWQSRWTSPSCCRPTTSAMASIISATS